MNQVFGRRIFTVEDLLILAFVAFDQRYPSSTYPIPESNEVTLLQIHVVMFVNHILH